MPREALRTEELDVARSQFGFRIKHRNMTHDKTNSPLLELFTEDDGQWGHVTSFDAAWLDDMIAACRAAKEKMRRA